MALTRRDIGRLALGAAAAAGRLAAKPNSTFGGVEIGVVTYSFRALPGGAAEVAKYCVECGLGGIELAGYTAEAYAGAPVAPTPMPRAKKSAQSDAAARLLTNWRLTASMGRFKELRKMYGDAGVKIYAFKLPPTLEMSAAEYDYIWNVGETLGVTHLTMELPTQDELLHRVAEQAAKRKLRIAFHTHGQGGAANFDKVLGASAYTALNFDVGHYYGVNGESPVPLVEKYHERIASLHLKDRKGPDAAAENNGRPGGPNVPWGQGGTPLKEVLQTMKRRKFKFPASIEYEYNTPEGSSVLAEVGKCVEYCRKALA